MPVPREHRNADLAGGRSKPYQHQITQKRERMHPFLRSRFLDPFPVHRLIQLVKRIITTLF